MFAPPSPRACNPGAPVDDQTADIQHWNDSAPTIDLARQGSSPDLVATIRNHGGPLALFHLEELQTANSALVHFIGVDPSHPLDLDGFLARLFPDNHDTALAALRSQRSGEVPLAPIRVSSAAHTLELTAGAGDPWMLAVRDCTAEHSERRRLLAALDDARRYADLGELLPGCAHDLNNILTVLAHTIDLADGLPPEGLARLLATRDSQLAHGQALTRAISRLGMDDDQPGPADPVALIQRFCRTFVNSTRHPSLRFTPPDEPHTYIHVDRIRFERILLNLMVNARNAAGVDGVLDITLERWPAARVAERTRGQLQGAAVCVTVRDDGPGIPADVLPHVFDEGFTTRPEGGLGLGLSTTRRLMHSVGGAILAESEPGAGATFRLLFPEPEPS